MSKQSKNDSSEFINEILKNESSVDLDKVEYWTGNNKRSEFEEYMALKDSENHLELTRGLNNADGVADVLATSLEYKNKEKRNDVFFDQISQTIPKHDYLDKYPPLDDLKHYIKMEQKETSEGVNKDVKEKEDTYEGFKENTSDITSNDEDDTYEGFKGNTSDINSNDEDNTYEGYKENTSDITSNDEDDTYEGYKENTSDITSNDEDDTYEGYKENTSDITSNDEDNVYEVYKENTSDITGQTETKEDLDELKYDLKP